MEMKKLIDNYGIVGIIGNYKNKINSSGKIKDIGIDNINNALKMVSLDDSYLEKYIVDLSFNELFKIELMTKLKDDVIIIGNLSNSLIYKDCEYIKKLLIKLNKDYNKKIVVIDNNIKTFFNLTKIICATEGDKILYKTDDFFDDNLYTYINKPNIVDFIQYVNKEKKVLDENIDIYELIKDIYRNLK